MKDGDKLVKQERIKANKRLWQTVNNLKVAIYDQATSKMKGA